jgi:hypothetical protein
MDRDFWLGSQGKSGKAINRSFGKRAYPAEAPDGCHCRSIQQLRLRMLFPGIYDRTSHRSLLWKETQGLGAQEELHGSRRYEESNSKRGFRQIAWLQVKKQTQWVGFRIPKLDSCKLRASRWSITIWNHYSIGAECAEQEKAESSAQDPLGQIFKLTSRCALI